MTTKCECWWLVERSQSVTSGAEQHACIVAPSFVTYLEVIFFVWVLGVPFITGHLSTKEKGKNYPWIHVKACPLIFKKIKTNVCSADCKAGVQAGLQGETKKKTDQTNPCPPPNSHLLQHPEKKRRRRQIKKKHLIIPSSKCYYTFVMKD